jgi:hypothetical protein
MKGDGNANAWSENNSEEKSTILDKATLLEKGIVIPNHERFMWTQTKQNYEKHAERMEN